MVMNGYNIVMIDYNIIYTGQVSDQRNMVKRRYDFSSPNRAAGDVGQPLPPMMSKLT